MRVTALALLLLTGTLTGCIGGSDDQPIEEQADPDPEIIIDAQRPRESLGDVITGPAVGPDLNATTEAAPRLVVGEWWRIRFDNSLDEDIEVVRVVADVHDEGYVIGMPHEGWLKEAIAYHSPAFGDVNLDLSYDTHNEVFQPLRFPLVQGDTWEAEFATASFTAFVEDVDEYTATIRFTPQAVEPGPMDVIFANVGPDFGDGSMVLTYDARMHEIVKMVTAIGTWEVIEHGYDFEGWVTIPRGEHTAIDYGTFGPVSETHDPLPKVVEVVGGFNRMTMMHFILPLSPGVYKIKDVGPNDEVFETNATTDFVLRFYESTSPDGIWEVQDLLGGVGVAYSMGIAYHQYDIRLPDGLRRSDHSHPVIR